MTIIFKNVEVYFYTTVFSKFLQHFLSTRRFVCFSVLSYNYINGKNWLVYNQV